ncbi:MAG: glycosyltransferase family 9 protein [Bacteroidota bacterium]|nr:glycosyltransferase family 9 protein [Bacteroidota bacterium]
MTTTFHRILLTRMKFIGDVVLTTPLIHTLRDTFPEAYIAYLGDAQAVSLLEHNPYLDEIIPFDFRKNSFIEQLRVASLLRKKKFDLAIDLFCNPRSALLTFATGAPVRVGGDLRGRRKLYTIRIRDDGTPKSAIDFHYQSLKAAGIQPLHHKTEIFLADEEKAEAHKFLKHLGIDVTKRIVAIHPGATWRSKKWLPERFARLSDKISTELNAETILTAGTGDFAEVQSVQKAASQKIKALPVLPLRKLAAVLAQCSVFVTNDCGPMHIAAAVGASTVGIFGPGEDTIWFPYTPEFAGGSPKHIALRKDIPCHPCHLNVCNRPGENYMECMKLLLVEEVFQAVRKRLPEISGQ